MALTKPVHTNLDCISLLQRFAERLTENVYIIGFDDGCIKSEFIVVCHVGAFE